MSQPGGNGNGAGEKDPARTNPLDFLFDPYESKIPKEIEADIYRAEANTAPARDRTRRVALLAAVAVAGVLAAFFNGFLTELRGPGPLGAEEGTVPFDLSASAFGWVESNPLFAFLFLNKIGGGLMLLLGCGSGLLAESELDGRRANAERIWEEMQRRREASDRRELKKQLKKLPKQQQQQQLQAGGPNRKGKSSLGKKQAKRLTALSEVVDDPDLAAADAATDVPADGGGGGAGEPDRDEASEGGIFRGIKDMYAKADSMAASQALLLNKRLEDAGLIDKITDETGLKVIGKEAASASAKQDESKPRSDKHD
jgi:hypothetical protein